MVSGTVEETVTAQVYYTFTPEETGFYGFYSTSDSDTFGYLLDANCNELTYNDDGGEGSNLRITGTGEVDSTPWREELQGGMITAVIENGITNIPHYAFYRCTGLTGIIIPGSVTSIGEEAFLNCENLETVFIPASVTSIEAHTFRMKRGEQAKKYVADEAVYSSPAMMSLANEEGSENEDQGEVESGSEEDSEYYNIPNLTLQVIAGSNAETYAQNEKIPYTSFKSLSEAEVTVSAQTYTGKALKPVPHL